MVGFKVSSSNLGLVFLVTSHHPEAISGLPATSHLISIGKDTHHSRDAEGLKSSYVGNQGQRPNIKTKDVFSTHITQEITSILGTLCQETGAETLSI